MPLFNTNSLMMRETFLEIVKLKYIRKYWVKSMENRDL